MIELDKNSNGALLGRSTKKQSAPAAAAEENNFLGRENPKILRFTLKVNSKTCYRIYSFEIMIVLEDTELVRDLGNLNLGDARNPIDELDAATRALDNEALIDRIHPKLPGLEHVLDTLREVCNLN